MSMLFVQVERAEELIGRADDYFRRDLCSDDAAKRKPMTNADRVPPHGRLIDADALMGRIEHDTPLSSTFEKVVRRYIEEAPTIIPAEEGE